MKRKITKILAALALLVFMTPSLVAWGQTYSLTPNATQTGLTNTTYITTLTGFTYNSVSWKMNQWNPSTLQVKTNQSSAASEWRFYNTSAIPGRITQVVISFSALTVSNENGFMFVGGTSEVTATTGGTAGTWNSTNKTITWTPGTNDDFTYFAFYQNGKVASGTNYLASTDAIVVTYSTGGTQPTTHTLTFSVAPDESGSIVVGNNLTSPATVAEEAELNISATANTGYVFNNWTVTGEGSSVSNATNASTTFIMGTEDATLTANFTQVNTYTVTYYANVAGSTPIEVTYNEGETVTIADNTFSYPGHAFTKWNTNENGTGTDYMPGDEIEDIDDDINLYAQWEESNETVDVINHDFVGITSSTYTAWSDKTGISGAVYAGQSAGGDSNSGDCIQLRSNNNNSGIVTTTSGGIVRKVVVTWNSATSDGRTLNVYGKNTAYSAATDLYGDNAGNLLGTIVKGTSTELTIEGNYAFVGLRSNSGAMYLNEIKITWEAGGTPDPSITANNVSIDCDATSGEIAFTINDGVEGGVFSAEVVGTPTIANFTLGEETTSPISFTCAANTTGNDRTATVKLTYTYGDEQTTTTNVTITQAGDPNATDDISDITEAGSYAVKGKIFAKSTKGFVLGDGTGYVYVYKTTSNNVGDYVKVTGTVTDEYNGIFEFQSGSTITSVDAFEIAAADPTVMTGSAITTFVDYEGAVLSSYVQYEGVLNISTSGNSTYYNLTIDGTDVKGSISYPTQDLTSFNGKAVRVTGYYVGKSGSTTTYFNTMLESISTTEPSITVDPILVNATIEGGSGTLMVTYENIATINANVFFCDEEGEAATYDWVSATINTSNNVEYTINANEGAARTAYMKVYVGETYSSLITINQAGLVAIDLRGVTTSLTFNAGDFTSSGSGYKDYDDVTYTGSNNVEYGGWTLRQVMHSGENMQMKASTGKVYMPTILTDNGFTITVVAETNSVLVGVGEDSEENEFTTTATSADVVISAGSKYAVISTITITPTQAPTPGYTYTVNGYGNSDGGYVLMATPTAASVDPATVGMITDQLGANVTPETSTYDLYSYDQAQDKEWRNYRVAQNFELEPGKGYLYASKDGVTLTFTGDLNPAFDDVALPYTEGNAIKSLYLAGNSSTEAQTFYVYDYDNDLELQTVNFLTMNGTGDGFTTTVATSLTAQPMQGFFVQSAGSNWLLSTEDLSDGTNNNQGVSLLNINVMRDRGNVIDNAIVSFSEGSMMNKFYLKDNTTRVYIPQGNQDFAVVRSANEGEMPVSFKASENGTYTLAIETENVEMNYLHLIDNLTGMDVDLLQTPSYTFEAKTNDYTSRFRLVFKASSTSSEADGTFAYFNGSNWTVSNLGEATLQVVDVTGRTVSSETINGNATISLNQTPGVYMLRLVNGNSVKVQKVVVR